MPILVDGYGSGLQRAYAVRVGNFMRFLANTYSFVLILVDGRVSGVQGAYTMRAGNFTFILGYSYDFVLFLVGECCGGLQLVRAVQDRNFAFMLSKLRAANRSNRLLTSIVLDFTKGTATALSIGLRHYVFHSIVLGFLRSAVHVCGLRHCMFHGIFACVGTWSKIGMAMRVCPSRSDGEVGPSIRRCAKLLAAGS